MAVVEISLPATPIVPAAGRKRVVPAEEGVKGDGERVVDPVQDRVIVRRVMSISKVQSADHQPSHDPGTEHPLLERFRSINPRQMGGLRSAGAHPHLRPSATGKFHFRSASLISPQTTL